MYAASEQSPIYRVNNSVQISGFCEIVIHFGSDAAHCGFKSRVPRQENRYAIWISFSHGMDDCESIAFAVNIDVRQQHIELMSLYCCEGLRDIGCDLHLKPTLLQDRRKRQTNARFIIDKSTKRRRLPCSVLVETLPRTWFSSSSRASLAVSGGAFAATRITDRRVLSGFLYSHIRGRAKKGLEPLTKPPCGSLAKQDSSTLGSGRF